MLHLKSRKMVQGRKSASCSDCQTCMLETEGSCSESRKGRQVKGNSFFPGPFDEGTVNGMKLHSISFCVYCLCLFIYLS